LSLSPPHATRKHIHTRSVHFEGFERDDGMWDIESQIRDTKADTWQAERGLLSPGDALHDMRIRVTIDTAFVIRAIESSMQSTPFSECQQAKDAMQSMVGVIMGPGWRRAIDSRLGSFRGCTHLRELLFNMATVAYQTAAKQQGSLEDQAIYKLQLKQPPFHLGQCLAWELGRPVVQRHYPQFFTGATTSQTGETDPT
jgi:hypothetical protein